MGMKLCIIISFPVFEDLQPFQMSRDGILKNPSYIRELDWAAMTEDSALLHIMELNGVTIVGVWKNGLRLWFRGTIRDGSPEFVCTWTPIPIKSYIFGIWALDKFMLSVCLGIQPCGSGKHVQTRSGCSKIVANSDRIHQNAPLKLP